MWILRRDSDGVLIAVARATNKPWLAYSSDGGAGFVPAGFNAAEVGVAETMTLAPDGQSVLAWPEFAVAPDGGGAAVWHEYDRITDQTHVLLAALQAAKGNYRPVAAERRKVCR